MPSTLQIVPVSLQVAEDLLHFDRLSLADTGRILERYLGMPVQVMEKQQMIDCQTASCALFIGNEVSERGGKAACQERDFDKVILALNQWDFLSFNQHRRVHTGDAKVAPVDQPKSRQSLNQKGV